MKKRASCFWRIPNNPTGRWSTPMWSRGSCAGVPGHVVVVLDEAYYEFAAHFAASAEGRVFAITGLCPPRGERGCAANIFEGARVGGAARGLWAWARRSCWHIARACGIRSRFRRWRRLAAMAALDDLRACSDAWFEQCGAGADFAEWDCRSLGFRVVPTVGEFFLLRSGRRCRLGSLRRLRGEGVSVRPLGAWGAPNCVRVSIGTAEQNQISSERRAQGRPGQVRRRGRSRTNLSPRWSFSVFHFSHGSRLGLHSVAASRLRTGAVMARARPLPL